jgi:endonuclease IV
VGIIRRKFQLSSMASFFPLPLNAGRLAHIDFRRLYKSVMEAHRLGMDTIQIFTKNQRSWKEKIISEEEGKDFKAACYKYCVKQVFSHTIYLISLGSENEEIAQKSMLSWQWNWSVAVSSV